MISAAQRSLQYSFLAANMTLKRAGANEEKRAARIKSVVDRLGMMHGLPQKIGQLLAFSEIESSDEAYQKLTEGQAHLDENEALIELERRLRRPQGDLFKSFDPVGIGASIGQAHKATLHDGRKVAVKIQYPGISDSIRYDLKALGWLMKPLGSLNRGFDVGSYRQEIGESLYRELDYDYEAKSLERFATALSNASVGPTFSLEIPEFIQSHSCAEVLTTTWIDGRSIAEAVHLDLHSRQIFSKTLVELFLKSLLEWGFLHADPNPGNYRFRKDGDQRSIGLIDFGCMKEIKEPMRQTLRETIFRESPPPSSLEQLLAAFTSMGFNPDLLNPIKQHLPAILEALRKPLTCRGPFNPRDWKLSANLKNILGRERMNFRMAGPPELVFILRSFQGLVQFLTALNAPVDWKEPLARIDSKKWETRPNPLSNSPQALKETGRKTICKSELLHIEVQENGRTKVKLTYGTQATDSLQTLVPKETQERIKSQGIDLQQIISKAQDSDYAKGELFRFEEGRKTVAVWLD